MFDSRKTLVRIMFGIVVGVLAVGMLLYLVPQGTTTGSAPNAVAQVGDQSVTVADIRQQLDKIRSRGQQIPRPLEGIYAQQIFRQLVLQKELEYEARRLGIQVTDEELADRIRQILPGVSDGGGAADMERYTSEVRLRFDMSLPEFENAIRDGLLEEKFRRLVTDGISVAPGEVREEFQRRNEKVKLEYVFIKPDDIAAKLNPSQAELTAYFEKNRSRYTVPEQRVLRYALLDFNQLRQRVQVSDDELRAIYNERIGQYQVPNRTHVEHILFKTIGKTDAEVEEIRKKAEDVLKQAKKGAKFEDLAKKYSEDATKDKGGDLGWIERGQTVPEFEKVAFSLPKGAISDLVKTQFGFHIIKVVDRENAHTKPFEEVRDSLRGPLVLQKADELASQEADKIAGVIRKSSRTPLDEVGKQFSLTIGETRPVSASDPLLELGNSAEVKDTGFRLREGELSAPIRTDRGYVVISVKEIRPAHPGTFAEVRDRVLADWKRERSAELAKSKADDFAKRLKAGESAQAAAKALDLEAKTSDLITRTGSIQGVASGRQLSDSFRMSPGQSSAPVGLGANWLVYRVVAREEAKPADFDAQRRDLEQQVLQSKRSLAYAAFQSALEARLKQEGKLKMMPDRLKSFGVTQEPIS